MSPLQVALVDALLFLLTRAATREPDHYTGVHRECDCTPCRHKQRIEREAV